MQGKGLIKLFFILLVLVSLLQIFYTFPTGKVERDAESFAEMAAAKGANEVESYQLRKEARASYLDSMSSEEIFKIPLFQGFTYDDLKKRQLNLGLDLKGGMSAVLEVDLKELLVRLSGNSRDQAFNTALENAEAAKSGSQSDFINLFFQEYRKIPAEQKTSLARIFSRDAELKELMSLDTDDGEVVRLLREKADETVLLTFNRLKQRIDKLGVTQPNVNLDAARDLILVEMPGIDNPARARNFLQSSAALEFWNTYRINDPGISGAFQQADKVLGNNGEVVVNTVKFDTIYTPTLDSLGQETGDSTFQVVERANDVFNNAGPLLSIFDLNGANGGLAYPQSVMGAADRNKKKTITELLNKPAVKNLFPADSEFYWSRKPSKFTAEDVDVDRYDLYLIKKQTGSNSAPLEGDVIVSASASPNTTGEMAVGLKMDNIGAKKWAQMTTDAFNAGQREIAIVLDDEVVSAPNVNGPITGGNSEITGSFTVQEANDFSSILEVGKLPAKTKLIQESTVGPTLGAENISRSIKALLIGLSLVLLFMVFYYGGAGIISLIALLLNLFFIFGALASFGTVLTLPGFAGIILTVGMAVDANVIIFERVREELRAGKSLLASVTDGFRNSYSAIVDANVTTLLVALVLFYYGLGPIKGFATILIIGVLCSMFTAVLIGRMMIDWWISGDRNLSFWTGPSKNMFANLNIDWIGKRKIAYIVSGTLIVAGLASIFTQGFDLGVDFQGGYKYDVQFTEDVTIDAETLRSGLEEYLGPRTVVKAVDTRNTFNIVTPYLINEEGDDVSDRVITKLHEGITAITGKTIPLDQFKLTDVLNTTHVTSSSKVGPTIADDIKKSSWYAGVIALILIFLYLFLRFNKWQFSLGAVAAVLHDSLIVLGLFSLLKNFMPFSMEIDQAFIAAILTVIGYSINDTVVVFDRIREDLGIYTNKPKDEVINMALNSTFSRTIITSVTTLLGVLILLVFGGASTKGFAFALVIGIIVGTYSSIFIATPIVRDLTDNLKAKKVQKKERFSKALN